MPVDRQVSMQAGRDLLITGEMKGTQREWNLDFAFAEEDA